MPLTVLMVVCFLCEVSYDFQAPITAVEFFGTCNFQKLFYSRHRIFNGVFTYI